MAAMIYVMTSIIWQQAAAMYMEEQTCGNQWRREISSLAKASAYVCGVSSGI